MIGEQANDHKLVADADAFGAANRRSTRSDKGLIRYTI
jgi:hypothetical protein